MNTRMSLFISETAKTVNSALNLVIFFKLKSHLECGIGRPDPLSHGVSYCGEMYEEG